jgi:hypothetical protein
VISKTFPDLNPVSVMPTVAAGSALYGDITDVFGEFAHVVNNNDAVAHNWRGFLRGTGIPGGEVEVGTPTSPNPYLINALSAADTNLSQPIVYSLMAGQRFDLEMVEAVNTTAPIVAANLLEALVQSIVVRGRVPGNQIELVNDTTPSIIAGPPAGARLRRIGASPLAEQLGGPRSMFFNRDYAAGGDLGTKTTTYTLLDPVNGDRVLFEDTVTSGGFIYPLFGVELEQGQSLKLEVTEATHVTDPFIFWYFEDLL